jgi:hypothetical protein
VSLKSFELKISSFLRIIFVIVKSSEEERAGDLGSRVAVASSLAGGA